MARIHIPTVAVRVVTNRDEAPHWQLRLLERNGALLARFRGISERLERRYLVEVK